jgi:hypothetical protein
MGTPLKIWFLLLVLLSLTGCAANDSGLRATLSQSGEDTNFAMRFPQWGEVKGSASGQNLAVDFRAKHASNLPSFTFSVSLWYLVVAFILLKALGWVYRSLRFLLSVEMPYQAKSRGKNDKEEKISPGVAAPPGAPATDDGHVGVLPERTRAPHVVIANN